MRGYCVPFQTFSFLAIANLQKIICIIALCILLPFWFAVTQRSSNDPFSHKTASDMRLQHEQQSLSKNLLEKAIAAGVRDSQWGDHSIVFNLHLLSGVNGAHDSGAAIEAHVAIGSPGHFFEAVILDINASFAMRVSVNEHENGTYTIAMRLPNEAKAGNYVLRVFLLTFGGRGLGFGQANTPPTANDTNRTKESYFSIRSDDGAIFTRECGFKDLSYPWTGFWLRVDPNLPCLPPACIQGSASPQSVMGPRAPGWVYRLTSCAFKLFPVSEARRCLNGSWLMFYGDSNHQDTLRNLMQHALGLPAWNPPGTKYLPREFDHNETYSSDLHSDSFFLRTTLIWNAGPTSHDDYYGIRTYDPASDYKERVGALWRSAQTSPSFLIVNDGLHSGQWARGALGLREFYHRARKDAIPFWLSNPRGNTSQMPRVFFRTTVAPGNTARWEKSNPQSVLLLNDVYAALFSELQTRITPIIDSYDMTTAWHWDGRTNDGGHYGRSPEFYGDFAEAHEYFVDDMLCQTLLSGICSSD